MSKSIYFYGVMKSSKTAQLLTMNYNYHKNGVSTVILKPKLDGKDNLVTSRIGIKATADVIIDTVEENQLGLAYRVFSENILNKTRVVLVDEAQFMDCKFIIVLSNLCKLHDIDLYAFGLLKDYKGKLFLGAAKWLECVDSIREVKTTCELCNHKATCNALEDKQGNLVPDTFIKGSGNVHIGDQEYHVYCRYHMLRKMLDYCDYDD